MYFSRHPIFPLLSVFDKGHYKPLFYARKCELCIPVQKHSKGHPDIWDCPLIVNY